MSMLSPHAAQTLRKLNMRQQEQMREAIYDALADVVGALQGDAAVGAIIYFDGNDWVPTAGTPSEGAVLTIVSGVPTWV